MPEESAHSAFRVAYRFVHAYLEQVDRLLGDITDLLSKDSSPWRRLRPSGESYLGEPKLDPAGRWLPDCAFAFYARADAFPSASAKAWGVPASRVPIVAFVGAVLTPKDDVPELYIGWVEGYEGASRNDTVENVLRGVFDYLDPEILEDDGAREIVKSLEGIAWGRPCSVREAAAAYKDLRVSLRRVPLSLIHSGTQLSGMVAAFRRALDGAQAK